MLVILLLFLPSCIVGTFPELYDVTTIYRVDEPAGGVEYNESPMSAEIHARTNALGLPFLVAGNVVEPEIGVEVPRCVALRLSDVRCDWDLDNWDWTVREEASFLDTGDWSQVEVTGSASKYLRFDEALFVRFSGLFHNQSYMHIILTPSRAYIQRQERFYYLQISKLHQSFVYRCDNRIFERFTRFRDLDDNIISVYCLKLANITVQMDKWAFGKVNAENYLWVEIHQNGSVQLWNTKVKSVPMFSWLDPQPFPVNFFTIRTDESENAQVTATNYGKGQVLSMSKNVNVASITSPAILLPSRRLCMSVVYFTNHSTTPTVLTVSYDRQTVHLGELNNHQDGWKVGRFLKTLPESMAGKEIKIHIKSVKNEGDLVIQRIAGCNAEDDEDIATISVLGGFSQPNDRIAYTVAVRSSAGSEQSNQYIQVGDCENGGLVFSENKCACPAGFTGDHCEIGCGANKYGRDCKGLCSLREQACRGLTLCTPVVGCFCAPGYKGYHCNQTCEGLRQYGAGCTQRCNHCAGECDIYTGVCTTSCKPGFYPPYCKTLYSYTQFAPLVNTANYGEVTATVEVDHILGNGKPIFVEIQYKLSEKLAWLSYRTVDITQAREEVVILNLEHGVWYDVRAILIDQDLNSYEGSLVPYSRILTSCYVPEEYDYKLDVETTDSTITAKWVYEPEEPFSCPVVNYELSWQEGWRWLSRNITNTIATLIHKLPVTQYKLRVRALTSSDYAPYSDTVTACTKKHAPGPVSNISLVDAGSSWLTLSWSAPADKDLYQLNYAVDYQCRRFAACERECGEGGEAHVSETQVTLKNLQPLAQYHVTVSAVDGLEGQNKSAVFATQQSKPHEVLKKSSKEPEVTDSSVTVFWQPTDVCSSFFQEYAFQLFQDNDLSTILYSGTTKDNFATFEELEAKTLYSVKVFIVTSGGWNEEKYILINATTKAAAPLSVERLTVYKTARQLLGLRWAEPVRTYGDLDSFLVSLQLETEEPAGEWVVMLTHCDAWPHLYCHTVTNLTAETEYTVTVRARNKEVSEYGPSRENVYAITNEKAPEKPASLQVVNITTTSFALTWGFPQRANGILRSFLVTVAETERLDYDQCCKTFPNIEVDVTAEQPTYQTEIAGLNPASTYTVSVTGKTIVLGASESLTVHTQPPHQPVRDVPSVELPDGSLVEWLPTDNSSHHYLSLLKGNMVVVLTDEERTPELSGVDDLNLYSLIRSALNSNFFTIRDYRGNDFFELERVGSHEGVYGDSRWELKEAQPYQLAAVQLLKYFTTFSVDVLLSKPFQIIYPTSEQADNKVTNDD